MAGIDTHDASSLTGATYFVVGRGTEGGPSSYHLSIAGVTSGRTDPGWGNAGKIVADSGYSLGTIQVDLGKRGEWPLGAIADRPLKAGETTYVDGIIEQSRQYAAAHKLPYTQDTSGLRDDLLSHGNGKGNRSTLQFIDKDTRDSINAWASSDDGQKWIHKNVDYPQVKNATSAAMNLVDTYGKNIPDDRRLETVAILAKTENQIPSQMKHFEKVLKDGGNYDDVLAKANQIKEKYPYYDGPKAASIAEHYKQAYADPTKAAALDRAHVKVGDPNFSPAASANDPDINAALKAIGTAPQRSHGESHGTLREHSHGAAVKTLQEDLARLGYTDAKDRPLKPDNDFGPSTKAALEKFQADRGLTPDGIAGSKTLEALAKTRGSLADEHNPGHAMYGQALGQVRAIDAERGRPSDHMTNNLAASLATASHAAGLKQVDHVVMSDDGKRAYAVQGELNSPFKRIAEVDVATAVKTPVEQSSTQFQKASEQQAQLQRQQDVPTQQAQPTQPPPQHTQPAMAPPH